MGKSATGSGYGSRSPAMRAIKSGKFYGRPQRYCGEFMANSTGRITVKLPCSSPLKLRLRKLIN